MAKTIDESFDQFKQNLNITTLQTSTISTRQTNVRDVLEKELKVLDTFLTGSYIRNTLIAPLSEADIDIFAVLNSEYYYNYNNKNGGQAGLLDLTKRVLKKTYTRTPDISRNGQAVTIRFDDFIVDVVPAFNRQGGGYLIPNSITESWIETDPKKHVELIKNANTAHNGDLVPLIKMIKCWNRKNNRFFHSFHLEILALEIFSNVTISDYPSGVRFFFDKGKDLISKQNLDPAGLGGDIGNYLNTAEKIQQAVEKFQTGYERAIKAESLASSGYISTAVEKWIQIFGNYFPSYG